MRFISVVGLQEHKLVVEKFIGNGYKNSKQALSFLLIFKEKKSLLLEKIYF